MRALSPSLQCAVARRSLAAAAPAARAAPPMTRHLWTPQRHKAQGLTSSELWVTFLVVSCQLSKPSEHRMFITFLVLGSFIHFDQLSTPLFFKAFRPPFCYAFQKKGATCTTSQFQITCVFFLHHWILLKIPKTFQLQTAKELYPSHHGTFCGLHQEYYSCIHLYRVGLLTPGSFQKKIDQQKSNGTVDGRNPAPPGM